MGNDVNYLKHRTRGYVNSTLELRFPRPLAGEGKGEGRHMREKVLHVVVDQGALKLKVSVEAA